MAYSAGAIIVSALLMAAMTTEAHTVRMRGAPSCMSWTANRPANASMQEAWLLGFVSGMAQEMDKHVPDEATEDAIFNWMDDYCKRNPSHSMAIGGYFYFGKLRGENKFR